MIILHRRIENFFDDVIQPVDFIDEKNIALFEVGQEGGKIAGALDQGDRPGGPLTFRERQVLSVASEGLTSREIADRLGVRERTVTTHLARIYRKLGVRSRLAAVRVAARSGLVTIHAAE